MSELVKAEGNTLATKMQYAQAMSGSSLLPRDYQGKPANLLFALEYADALGIAPIHAITSIHVINGKPSASADLIAASVRRAGHKLRITGDDKKATAQIIRADDPDFTYEATWDQAKASKAGLWGTGNWAKYPAAMLRSRAITEVARMGASDALYGVIYTPEELGAEVDADGAVISTTATAAPAPATASRIQAAMNRNRPAPVAEPEVLEEAAAETDAATLDDLNTINGLLEELGQTDRTAKLMFLSDWTGRTITSSTDLTKDEAHRFIEENTTPANVTIDGELVEMSN
jgi:hypothetical protein